MERREYFKQRILTLMATVENKYNHGKLNQHKACFELLYPELTETIWNTIDETYQTGQHNKLAGLVETLNKLSDSY